MVATTPLSGSLPDGDLDQSPGSAPEQSTKSGLDQSPSSPPEKSAERRNESDESSESDVNDIHAKDVKDNFRSQYLRRLFHEKVWVPPEQRSPKHQTLIIFDWDDTLMYSNFLLHSAGRIVTPTTRKILQAIEKTAFALLETAMRLGNTFIVTNATEGWVEQCVDWHMPSMKQLIKKVPVISARSKYEADFPDARQWKNRAFLELGKQLDPLMITNLVAVGDSNFEMEAVQLLGQQFPNSFIKTVKLKERPSPEELMKELDLITPKFHVMVERANNMKVRLERRHMVA